jgi:hypothetical protein
MVCAMEQSSFDSQVIGQKDKSKSVFDVWKQVCFSPCKAVVRLLNSSSTLPTALPNSVKMYLDICISVMSNGNGACLD